MSLEDEQFKVITGILEKIEETHRRRMVKAEIDIQMLKAMCGILAGEADVSYERFLQMLDEAAESVDHPEGELFVVKSEEDLLKKTGCKDAVDQILKKAGGLH